MASSPLVRTRHALRTLAFSAAGAVGIATVVHQFAPLPPSAVALGRPLLVLAGSVAVMAQILGIFLDRSFATSRGLHRTRWVGGAIVAALMAWGALGGFNARSPLSAWFDPVPVTLSILGVLAAAALLDLRDNARAGRMSTAIRRGLQLAIGGAAGMVALILMEDYLPVRWYAAGFVIAAGLLAGGLLTYFHAAGKARGADQA